MIYNFKNVIYWKGSNDNYDKNLRLEFLNSFRTEVHIIQKPVHSFAEQIKMLVFI